MVAEQERLLMLANAARLPVEIRRDGHALRMAFETMADATLFRLVAFGPKAEFGRHTWTETFDAGRERERDLGLLAVRAWMADAGVDCAIDVRETADGSAVAFRFDRLSDLARFARVREDVAGFVAAAAHGPDASPS